MVLIGLFGNESVGKTSILRSTISYLSECKDNRNLNNRYEVCKEDFSGEAVLRDDNNEIIASTTIHPNRIILRDYESNKLHQIFSVGGKYRAGVVKMGIITISRLSDEIILVFSPDIHLKKQFEYFDHVKILPNKLYVCINKMDLFDDIELEEFKQRIQDYLAGRKISIEEFFLTCGNFKETQSNYKEYQENIIKMFIDLINNQKAD